MLPGSGWLTPQRKVWFIGRSICYTTRQFPQDVALPGSPVVFIDVPERERNGPNSGNNNQPLESAGKAEARQGRKVPEFCAIEERHKVA